jgi:hypothetical protein
MSDIDEQVIKRAAEAAIFDLQLNCRIEKVFRHPRNNDRWCIQFSGDYGQFCDEFRSKPGEENSPELIREKVKSHFFKMRRPVRVRRARSRQTGAGKRESIWTTAPMELAGQAIDRTASLVGEVINQVSGLARSALDTEAVVSVDLPAAAPPTPQPARRKKSTKAQRPAKRKPVKISSGKSTKKKSTGAGKASSKAGKAAKAVRRKSRATVGKTTSGRKGR